MKRGDCSQLVRRSAERLQDPKAIHGRHVHIAQNRVWMLAKLPDAVDTITRHNGIEAFFSEDFYQKLHRAWVVFYA
jgi:hypothetical protein